MINRYRSGHSIARGIYLANTYPELKEFNVKEYTREHYSDHHMLHRKANNLAIRCGDLLDVMLDNGALSEDIVSVCKVLMVAASSGKYNLDYAKACKDFRFYELCEKYGLKYRKEKHGNRKV